MHIKVRVTPGAKRERLEQTGETFVVSVREEAQGNAANTRVRELLARHFGVRAGDIRILTGHRARVKMVSVVL